MTQRARGFLLWALATIVLAAILFVLIETFVAQPYRVEQLSMQNTLQPDQYVLVDKLTPRFASYQRGDVVVFTPPGAAPGSIPFMKRVIGLPGETVDLRNGRVLINGQALDEPYVFPGQTTEPITGQEHGIVPAGMLFVMGDHREDDNDSRIFGPVPLANVIGRVWLRYWPLNSFEVIATPRYPDLAPLEPAGSPAAADHAQIYRRVV